MSADASQAREAAMVGIKAMDYRGFLEIQILGDEVSFYSTLTLAYRAISAPEGVPSRFCQECIDAARRAMGAHLNCMSQITQGGYLKAIYVHW